MDGELITTKELTARWNCTKFFIQQLRKNEGLPFLKLGSEVRFRPSDIEAWLNAREHNGGDAA